MNTVKRTIQGKEFLFVNQYGSNRSGFYHDTTLLRNGWEEAHYRAQYYNRTWEEYMYQSSMKQAVRNRMDEIKSEIISDHKKELGISRVKQSTKDSLWAASDELKLYRELYESL